MYHQVPRGRRRRWIHERVRKKVRGTSERPRLAVFRSLKHIYAQIVDDSMGRTLISAGTRDKECEASYGGNMAAAKEVGKLVAQRAEKAGIKAVVLDRGGHLFHGRVKALAEAAREGGLEF
jgi:large subunit ribosomal protein L18